MLARDGIVTGNRIGPARSSCAIHVSSYNNNRENIYHQQQTISGCGLSGIAFSTNVPHTVRGGNKHMLNPAAGTSETKSCTDCHLSKNNDNNAIMAQLLMQGTNYTNFMGKYCWVAAGEHGFEAVVVTEQDEPQAVIGSSLHRIAYPERYREARRARLRARARPRASGRRHPRPAPPSAAKAGNPAGAGPRRISLRRLRLRRLPGVRHRLHRRQGLFRADHHRARLARRASSSTLRVSRSSSSMGGTARP